MERQAGNNFNSITPLYDALAFIVFGRKLQRAQVVWLDQIAADTSVLILGGGTGWLLEQVLTRCRPRRLVYLEASEKMVAWASRRMLRRGLPGSVIFRVGDKINLDPAEQFDVIMTPFVLDVFMEQMLRSQVLPQLRGLLKPTGLWLVTDFIRSDVWWQKILLWGMIRFFRITANIQVQQLADWQRLLAETGLIRQQQQHQIRGMVSAEVWAHPVA